MEAAVFLERHEARVHVSPGRQLRDLGDAVLVHDPDNREPFWNRLSAVRWPDDPSAFDRRLDEAITLFATIDRRPHVWPRMILKEPPDIVERLVANGFVDIGGGHVMVLADPEPALASLAVPHGVSVQRLHLVPPDQRRAPALAVAHVAAEAFDVIERSGSIEAETAVLFENPEVHVVLLHVDGQPAAVAKRSTFDGASYLSTIGTARAFRGRGLGRLVTAIVTADAIRAGSRWVHLGVFAENVAAITLYRSLGFTTLGDPAPDLILA